MKVKENKMKYQGKAVEKKPLVVRLPVGLKHQLDIEAKMQNISQSRLAVEFIHEGLNQSVVNLPDEAVLYQEVESEDKADLDDWLKRI